MLTVTRSKIQDRVDPSFMTKDMLMDTIDELPHGADWSYRPVTLHGDLLDDTGKARTEQLELWYRDPVEIVRELLGNPMFRDVMRYTPERIYQDAEGTERVRNEMWTAEWWWKMQVRVVSISWLNQHLYLCRNDYRRGPQ
jgi:hypothetical protein